MSTTYWPALDILKQISGELGLKRLTTISQADDLQAVQLISLLNSCGNEMMLYYPWEQFTKEFIFQTVADQGDYDLPSDWNYFKDQTQWDRTDHWPLLGPKSAQEWAWLKGSLVAALPRQRFRVAGDKFKLWPIPAASANPSSVTIAMEYVSKHWVKKSDGTTSDMVVEDGDVVLYNPWLVVKYVKFKFYDLKGFPNAGVQQDFLRVFNSVTGKDVGAKILSLAPRPTSEYIGPWSVPDGSWPISGA